MRTIPIFYNESQIKTFFKALAQYIFSYLGGGRILLLYVFRLKNRLEGIEKGDQVSGNLKLFG